MKKLGASKFGVKLGEEVELKITSANAPHLTEAYLDGIQIEPLLTYEGETNYKFKIEKPVGLSHEFAVSLPQFHNTRYEVELRGAGEAIERRLIEPTGSQSITNLIFTFSTTHGAGGGGRD